MDYTMEKFEKKNKFFKGFLWGCALVVPIWTLIVYTIIKFF